MCVKLIVKVKIIIKHCFSDDKKLRKLNKPIESMAEMKCSVCEKTFKSKRALDVHKRFSSKHKPKNRSK